MSPTVVVLGGYGVFGSRIAASLARHPELELLVAGRDAARAFAFAATLGPRPHRGWRVRKGPERKRCAERARKLRTQPAKYAQPGGGDLADEHGGFVRSEHAFEAFLHG